jgi:tRNA threonylcarbamoyladenosine biosynthesis protein TsaB
MKILAIDAATEGCSVALQIGEDVVFRFEEAPQQHSKKLLPFVDDVLAEAGVTLSQLDCIAYGQGPGSFTGVRIGVSVTQGLAFALDLPVVGVSSLAAMAQQAVSEHGADYVCSAIDARMSEVYWGLYKSNNGIVELVNSEVVSKPEQIQVQSLSGNVYQAGTGWETYSELLSEKINALRSNVRLPNAKFMLPLGNMFFSQGKATSADLAQPNYVRDEVSWKKLPGR